MNQTSELRLLVTALYYGCLRGAADRDLTNYTESGKLFCPRTFDGYLCWPRTEAGTQVSQQCPGFVTGFDASRWAHKTCLDTGKWFSHPDSGNEWSNYTTCVDVEDLFFRRAVNNIFVLGYVLSFTALVLSLAILLGFRSLRCTRTRIHMHLFLSLALGCMSWIVWYKGVVENPAAITEYPVGCIVLHLLIHYLMLTNYFWMFCEGMHLFLVLVVVFLRDNVVLQCFYAMGWGLPFIIIVIYGATRIQSSSLELQHSFEEDYASMWILTVPVSISLLASLGFLIYVVRVLVVKLSSQSFSQPSDAFRKAVRATLILFPLFGLQHILLPLRPDPGTGSEKLYQLLSAVIISCQGLSVSFLFCFANHEVVACLGSFLHRVFPWLFNAPHSESVNNPPPTQTRDVVV